MFDVSVYPKKVKLSGGEEALIRPLESGDAGKLAAFMQSLPPEERVYFRDDVSDPEVVDNWTRNIDFSSVIPLVAVQENQIIANWSLHLTGHGWTRHLADIRGIV